MSRIHLTLACGSYDINRGLISGDVRADGIDLTVVTAPSPERHWRMVRHREFDVAECSMGTYLMLHDQEPDGFVAIPAFPHRRFRHSYIFVNRGAGIDAPKDLEGRRVGLRSWQTTAGLWARGILQDEYGVDLRSITWLTQDEEDLPFVRTPDMHLERIPAGSTVTELLESGAIDALIYPEMPTSIRNADPRVARLFADPKAEEIAYVRKTGFFPIMHTVIIRRPVLEADPWIAVNLLGAFRASKDRAFHAMDDPRAISLAWLREAIEEQRAVLGLDPWCYEFEANRRAIETMIRWSFEQGMLTRRFPSEELFAASTLDRLPKYV